MAMVKTPAAGLARPQRSGGTEEIVLNCFSKDKLLARCQALFLEPMFHIGK